MLNEAVKPICGGQVFAGLGKTYDMNCLHLFVIHSTPHFQHSFTRERSAQRQRQRYDIRLSRNVLSNISKEIRKTLDRESIARPSQT